MKPPVPDLMGREVFITGAASGIGRALAVQAAAQGARVHLTDVQAPALDEVAAQITARGQQVGLVRALDISDHDAVASMARDLTDQYGAMQVLANVAGIASWGTVQAMTHEEWKRLIDINLLGPISVLEELVPPMIEAGRGGQVVNVSSAAGIIGMPWHAGYSASKFGLRGVSEVLRFDLAPHRIGVSLVCPGAVSTPLTQTVNIAGVDKSSPAFQKAQKRFRSHGVSPEQAAEAIIEGIRRNKYWVYTSGDIRAIHAVQRFFPPGYRLAMTAFNRVANRMLPDVQKARR